MANLTFNPAVISKITTTADGGCRISFDIDGSQGENVAALFAIRQFNEPVRLVVDYGGEGTE